MFLKRIEILGFKSFADKTVIDFADCITALIGPNGCGKSNIVDSIKWVLGEQSVRSMRAERMEDVIFSGTENRKALSIAEVTLVISNDNGILDIERPEIAIKRRIFRDGDNEYFLNGAPARLKEIRELFLDTGVGKSAYSVMEQGRIGQVLSNKPEERRYLFEEAASITKFRVRGGEAERKLVKTEENMTQVENILNEVRRSYETLKKQTDKTMEYRRLKGVLFDYERDLRLLQWRDLDASKQKKAEKLAACKEKREKVLGCIDRMKAALAGEIDAVNAMETRLIENQKRLYGMDLEKENQEEQLKVLREQRNETEEAGEAGRTREKNAVEALSSLNELRKSRENDLNGFQERLKEIESQIATLQESIEAAEERIKANAGEADSVTGDLGVEEKKQEALQEDLRSLTDDIVKQLDRSLRDSGFDRSRRRTLEDSIQELLGETRIRAEGRRSLLTDRLFLTGGDGVRDLLRETAGDFESLRDSLENLEGLFGEYKGLGADFLEEFLAPEGIITRKRELDEKINAASGRTRDLKDRLTSLAREKEGQVSKLEESRERLEEMRVAQARITTQAAAAEDSLVSLAREAESETSRLDEIRRRLASEDARIKSVDEQSAAIMKRREKMDQEQDRLRKDMSGLESGISSENKKMAGRENRLRSLTEEREKLDVEQEKIRLEMDYVDEEVRLLLEDFRDRHSRDLRDFTARREEISEDAKGIRGRLGESKAQLKSLGQVNLMAPEEFLEVSERYEFLSSQLEDLRKAGEDLGRITQEIRRESAALFVNTYKEIRENFHEMFRRLFGGGRAEISLLDPENPLESGLDIYAQPPGKKLENISLLSGGEKSLCGVALMFATFLVKPSPFCILDEVDAALDEANIQHFVNVLAEFGKRSQFLVITHNKKTVSGARSLLGVTMQESGVSKLITLRLDGEEAAEANEESAVAGR